MRGAGLRAGIWAALAAAVLAAPAAAESLADSLADAYRNSNLLEQNRAVLRAADEDVAGAVSALRPVVNFVASAGYSDPALGDNLTGSVALTAEITLFDFGSNRLGVDAARESVLATRQALLGVEQRVLLSAVSAYMDVVSTAEFVRLREANVRLIGEELRAANDRFEVGEVTRTDVSIAQARLAGANANLAAAQGDLQVAIENFRAAVGRSPGNLSGPGRSPQTAASLDEAQAIGVRTHPSIRQAQHEVTVAELNAERARLGTRGRLTGDAQVGLDQDGDSRSSVGLSFRQPIYQGGRLSALYRQALASRDASRAALLETQRTVASDIGTAWARLQVAEAQIRASEQQIRAAQVAFEGVQEEARLGARTTLDVLNAEQELLDARTARIDAGTQQVVAVYALLSAMGLLTVEHLGLGVPVYDPSAYYNAVRNAPATSVQGQRLDRLLDSLGRN
ncbi:MAG: TolC family outer membrane protein [Rhodobacteraceae bacterium]|jgi:outer membrane protein|nr:TolC family outer membrane protein [Paracoccaceae bacterium]